MRLARTIFFNSLRWLKQNLYVQELKLDCESDFMVSPRIAMNNCDFESRNAEWVRRQKLDIQREIRLRKEKRRREQKNKINKKKIVLTLRRDFFYEM